MKLIKEITGKELFKVTSLNSISVLIKIAIGFVTSKVIAVFVGPSGMALVGNLRNFITSIESIGTLGFQNGIVKYVAEKEQKAPELRDFLFTVMCCLAGITLLLSGLLFVFSENLNDAIFGANFQYKSVFRFFAAGLPWYVASLVMIWTLNGLGRFRKVIFINIAGNILGLIISVVLIYYYRTFGALVSVILAPSLLFFISVFFIGKEFHYFKSVESARFHSNVLRQLSEYSLMALVSSVLGPLVLLSIRKHAIDVVGIEAAGFWEAMTRISSYYLLFLSTILSVYFLPRLSKAVNENETSRIFKSYFKWIMPIFIFGLLSIFVLRDVIIRILFTKEFLPVSALFFWQLIGDVFKAASLILGYQFFAAKLTKAFVVTEVISLATLWLLSNYFINVFGIEGIVMAYALSYLIYFFVLCLYFRKYFIGNPS